jgi:hypothetical protein
MRQVIVVAKIAERLSAALRAALIAKQDSAINAFSNRRLGAANCVPARTELKLDLAGWKHLPGIVAEGYAKGERKLSAPLRTFK